MRVYVNGTLQDGGVGLPGTPADVLLDVANAGKLVALASTTGVGTTSTYGAAVSAGVGQVTAQQGDFPVGNGAGGSQLASTAAAAVRGIIGVTSGPTAGSGTYAARPATPALGDTYTVTSGPRLRSRYRCTTAGSWELDNVLAPTSVVPSFQWDAERAEEYGAAGKVVAWADERGRSVLSLASNRTDAPAVGTASFGSIAPVSWGANSGALRALETGPTQALARTMIVVLASVSTAADRAWAGWGGSGGSARTFCLRTRSAGSGGTTGLSFFGTDPWGTGLAPTTTTPTILSARYTGTQYALRQASLSGLSWAYSLALTTLALNTYGEGIAGGTLSGIVLGASAWQTTGYADTPAQGDVYAVVIYPRALTEAEEEAVGVAFAARFGS